MHETLFPTAVSLASDPNLVLWLAMGFVAAVAAGVAAVGGYLWSDSKSRRRKEFTGQLDAFKQQVMEYSALQDRFRERHRRLPIAAEDRQPKITGSTLAAYERVQHLLDYHRDRWLEFMDLWDRADKQLAGDKPLPGATPQDAASQLRQIDVSAASRELEAECGDLLERLERLPAEVQRQREQIDEATRAAGEQLQALEASGVAVGEQRAELESIGQSLSAARQRESADPLTAHGELEDASQRTARLREVLQRLEEGQARLADAHRRVDQLRGLLEQHRQQGFRFTERESDPQVPLTLAERALDAAEGALARGQTEPLQAALQRTWEAADETRRAMESLVAMRDRCENEIPRLLLRSRGLRGEIQSAALQRGDLERRFAEESWAETAETLEHARQSLDELESLLVRVQEVVDQQQAYHRAATMLDQIERQLEEIPAAIAQAERRVAELDAMREQSQQQYEQLRRQAAEIGQRLQSHTADRPPANQRFAAAVRAMEETAAMIASQRGDWPRVGRQLEAIRNELGRVEQLFLADVQLAQRAESEVLEAEREVRRSWSYYQHGIRADAAGAERTLAAARQALAGQQYEQAIDLANRAESDARMAMEQAERLIRQRSQRTDWDRRQHEYRQMEEVLEQAGRAAATVLRHLPRR